MAVLVAVALSACGGSDEGGGIELVDVSGPLDASALDFISDSIEDAGEREQVLVVLQLNSRAVLDAGSYERLRRLVADPPIPVAVWVGPAPAWAYGGVARLAETASHGAIAPGSVIGHFDPEVLGEDPGRSDEIITAEDTGLELQPTLRQYLQDLDGAAFHTDSGQVTVSTLRRLDDGGVTTKDITFRKPGLVTRFFRLAVTPEAAFFFLAIGASVAIFEFYALGPGVAAAAAALSLLLGGWGLVTLPTNWWAVVLVAVAFAVLVTAYQRAGSVALTATGAVMLQTGGTFLVDGGGQIDPRWWLVVPTVLGVLFFFLLAIPTVHRARLSTGSIGRDHLIGQIGRALVDFAPDGLVEVGGARWRGTAHRESGIAAGDAIEVTGVDGLYLEVERLGTERET